MTALDFEMLAGRLNCTIWVVRSWIETLKLENITDITIVETQLKEHQSIIKAQPFVKWVGGKRQLIQQFGTLLPKDFNNYFEPFLGGGAVFFNLQKKKSYLSDTNAELINSYQVIKKNPKELIQFLKSIKNSKEFYIKIRAWDRELNWTKNYSNIERAGRFIYLNRTCFNGLHRVNSRGEFNVPMGAYKNPDFIQEINILNTSELLRKTQAEIQVESFQHVLKKAKKGDFIYFDPPYDTLTETSNFTSYNKDGFGRDKQSELANVFMKLNKMGCKLMLSNHNTPYIRDLFDGFRFEIVKARRNINSQGSGRGEVEEIVVLNY